MQSLQVQNVVAFKPHVLLVDDELLNLEILQEYLEDAGYLTQCAVNGKEACEILEANPQRFHAVLLDRMMPKMGGIEVTHYMKQHADLKQIPIIIQTAKATQQDIQEGLNAGILYYLTKPFEKQDLLGIVEIAVRYYFNSLELCANLEKDVSNLELSGSLDVHNLAEAKETARLLANLTAEPNKTVVGLSELITNAIEHGNLGIGFDDKTRLLANDLWASEVETRLNLPENINKTAVVRYEVRNGEVSFNIKDEGVGFDFEEFLEISPRRTLNMHGRGIAIAKLLSFDTMNYIEPGNEVVVQSRAREDK